MDKVRVHGLRFHAKHGCHPEERLVGGVFEVDVTVNAVFDHAASSDNIEDAIDYVRIMTLCESVMRRPRNLIESVAKEIGLEILNAFDGASSVEVTVRKMKPPVAYDLSHVSVSTIVERSRNN